MRRSDGRLIIVVGPDGSGKSTVATALAQSAPRGSVHRYWRPGLLPGLSGGSVEPSTATNPTPHATPAQGWMRSTVRQLYYVADFLIGYLVLYRPLLRAGQWIIVERGFDDMLVDPRRYLMRNTVLLRLMRPSIHRADLLVILTGDAHAIHARKPELPPEEIRRQSDRWRRIARGKTILILDATLPLEQNVREIEATLNLQR